MKPGQKNQVRELCKKHGGLLSNNVNTNTTHLVTGTIPHEDKSAIITPRTLKSLAAIGHGIWLMSFDWVELSLNLGKWLLHSIIPALLIINRLMVGVTIYRRISRRKAIRSKWRYCWNHERAT